MEWSAEWFIHNENLRNFKRRLADATDDAQRKTLLTLLAEEEAKGEQLANKAKVDNQPGWATRSEATPAVSSGSK